MPAGKRERLVEPLDPASDRGRQVAAHLSQVLPRIEQAIAARKAARRGQESA